MVMRLGAVSTQLTLRSATPTARPIAEITRCKVDRITRGLIVGLDEGKGSESPENATVIDPAALFFASVTGAADVTITNGGTVVLAATSSTSNKRVTENSRAVLMIGAAAGEEFRRPQSEQL
jgi:hypothetical protein